MEDTMKTKSICFLSLMMIITSVAMAQQVGPCARPTGTLVVNWPKFHSDVCNTGYNPNEFIPSPTNVANLALKWKYTTGGSIVSSPAIANGVAFVGSEDGYLYAVK